MSGYEEPAHLQIDVCLQIAAVAALCLMQSVSHGEPGPPTRNAKSAGIEVASGLGVSKRSQPS